MDPKLFSSSMANPKDYLPSRPSRPSPEELARLFHETYERLAHKHNYETRKASAVPWEDVPENNKNLMIEVAGEVLNSLKDKSN